VVGGLEISGWIQREMKGRECSREDGKNKATTAAADAATGGERGQGGWSSGNGRRDDDRRVAAQARRAVPRASDDGAQRSSWRRIAAALASESPAGSRTNGCSRRSGCGASCASGFTLASRSSPSFASLSRGRELSRLQHRLSMRMSRRKWFSITAIVTSVAYAALAVYGIVAITEGRTVFGAALVACFVFGWRPWHRMVRETQRRLR
jgi:hypothetical protein